MGTKLTSNANLIIFDFLCFFLAVTYSTLATNMSRHWKQRQHLDYDKYFESFGVLREAMVLDLK